MENISGPNPENKWRYLVDSSHSIQEQLTETNQNPFPRRSEVPWQFKICLAEKKLLIGFSKICLASSFVFNNFLEVLFTCFGESIKKITVSKQLICQCEDLVEPVWSVDDSFIHLATTYVLTENYTIFFIFKPLRPVSILEVGKFLFFFFFKYVFYYVSFLSFYKQNSK